MKRFLLIGISLLALTACTSNVGQSEDSQSKIEEEPINQNDEQQEEQQEEPIVLSPLTGLEAKGDINQRPFSVMINNHPKARPQSGLHKADVVYEVLAEGSVTRFLAIYQSEQPEIIGPVRSARDYYIDLSKGYDAFYISHGWSPSAQKKLQSGEADYLNGLFYDGTLFWRDHERRAPHNSYISFSNLMEGAGRKGYSMTEEVEPLPFIKKEDETLSSFEPMIDFVVKYGNSDTWKIQYVYDESIERYKRYSANELTVDRETKEPVLLDNILVVEMEHQIIDNYGRRSIDIYSGGIGYLFQKGSYTEIEWKNVDGRILPYQNGQVVPFVPGRTWINIVPNIDKALQLTQM